MSWCSYRGKRLLCCLYPGSRTDRAITAKGKLRSEMATSTKHFLKVYFSLFSWFALGKKKNLLCLAFWINLVLGRIHPYKAPPQKQARKELVVTLWLSGGCFPWAGELGATVHPHGGSRAWEPGLSRCRPTAPASTGTALGIGHFTEDRDGPRLGRGISLRVGVRSTSVNHVLPGWGMAVAQLEQQLWGNPALHQAITVTLLQRLRAQLILFLFNGAVRKWEHRTWNYRHPSSPGWLAGVCLNSSCKQL